MRTLLPLTVAICCRTSVTSMCAASTTITRLRCEEVERPLGVEAQRPRLSWQINSDNRGWKQGSYRILVASSAKLLSQNKADLWDSGTVRSDETIGIAYKGKPLASGARYYWKVRVWDEAGKTSFESTPEVWSMGLLKPGDWHGQWIGYVPPKSPQPADTTPTLENANWIWYPEGDPAKSAPAATRWFRRTVSLPAGRTLQSAKLRVAADNDAVIFVNGKEVGKAYNAWQERAVFDLKNVLTAGENVIAIAVTNEAGAAVNPAGLAAQLDLGFQEGAPLSLVTDGAWKASNQLVEGWQQPDFKDESWMPAKVLAKTGSEPWGKIYNGSPVTAPPAPYLRNTFAVTGKIKRATAYICGLGYYEMSLNGRKVGDHRLDPGWTRYDRRSLYVVHDVTSYLKNGDNAIGVILGTGHYDDHVLSAWDFDKASWRTPPKMQLELRVEYDDGRLQTIVSDRTWKASTGPILFDSIAGGENYDARLEKAGWDTTAYNANNWAPVQVVEPTKGVLTAQISPPIKVTQVLKPVKITQPKPGIWIFDMGQNFAGVPELHISGPAGTEVTLRCAEKLHADGTLDANNIDQFVKRRDKTQQFQTEKYTLRGQGLEVWSPRFTYHGYQYVEVKGFPGTPTLENLRGLVLHTAFEGLGSFECSNPLLNHIERNTVWSYRSNFHSIPTDCPQREKNGWMGDAHLAAEMGLYHFDGLANYEKWLDDIHDEQQESGALPGIVPTGGWGYAWGNGPAWDSAYPLIVWYLYQYRNDRHVLERHYDRLRRYVDYVGTRSKDNIPSFGLDDWLAPKTKTPVEVTNTGYYYVDTLVVADAAQVLGKTEDAKRYRDLAAQIKASFNAQFFNPQTNTYANGSLTALSCALYQGLVPEQHKAAVVASLVAEVKKQGYHMDVGILGAKYLLNTLADNGHADVAYQMLQQKTQPSYGWWLEQGATTLWEEWNGASSLNHIMFGDVSAWFYKYLAGITATSPGFKTIQFKPHLLGDLKSARATYDSAQGRIVSDWKIENDSFQWQVTVPANTNATVYVPANEGDSITESSKAIGSVKGIRRLRHEVGYEVFEVGSGSYRFVRASKPR